MRYLRLSPGCALLLCLSTGLVAQTRSATWQADSLGIEDSGSSLDLIGLCIGPDTPWARCEYQKPTAFKLIILNTAECPACDSTPFLHSTANLFPGVQVKMAAAETAAGKDLARRYDIQVFPAYIFATEFARSLRFEGVRHMVVEKSGNYLLIPRILTTTYWSERHRQPDRLDLFVPGWIPEVEDEILRLWPRDHANVRVHHLWPPGNLDGIPEGLARRACLATHQPERYPAYAGSRSKTLQVADQHDWQESARSASVDLQSLQTCIKGGQGRDLTNAVQNLADTLQLAPATISALIGNQVLIRHARPEEIFRLWQEGNQL